MFPKNKKALVNDFNNNKKLGKKHKHFIKPKPRTFTCQVKVFICAKENKNQQKL